MASLGEGGAVARSIRRLFAGETTAGRGEGELVARFAGSGDPAAFEALVLRHGPMVRQALRRLLRDPNDVDDAFQATFLVLARRAGSLGKPERVGPWLHGVARRVALKARAHAARRRESEADALDPADPDDPGSAPERADVRRLLHEEVGRLPEAYRAAVVLCYFEGRTRDDAAAALGWPVGTVDGRLARAKALLRERLGRRGLTSAGAGLTGLLASEGASGAVPEPWIGRAVEAAARVAAGRPVAGVVAASAATLAGEVLRTMNLLRVAKMLAAASVVAGTLATVAATSRARDGQGPPPHETRQTPKEPAPVNAQKPRPGEDLVADDLELLRIDVEVMQGQVLMAYDRLESRQSEAGGNIVISLPFITEGTLDPTEVVRAAERAEAESAAIIDDARKAYLRAQQVLLEQRQRVRRLRRLAAHPGLADPAIPWSTLDLGDAIEEQEVRQLVRTNESQKIQARLKAMLGAIRSLQYDPLPQRLSDRVRPRTEDVRAAIEALSSRLREQFEEAQADYREAKGERDEAVVRLAELRGEYRAKYAREQAERPIQAGDRVRITNYVGPRRSQSQCQAVVVNDGRLRVASSAPNFGMDLNALADRPFDAAGTTPEGLNRELRLRWALEDPDDHVISEGTLTDQEFDALFDGDRPRTVLSVAVSSPHDPETPFESKSVVERPATPDPGPPRGPETRSVEQRLEAIERMLQEIRRTVR